MRKIKPFWLLVAILIFSLVVWFAFGYYIFTRTSSIWLSLLAMLLLFCVRFSSHFYSLFKGKRLLRQALRGVQHHRFYEMDIPDKVIWLQGHLSLGEPSFKAGTAVNHNYLYIFTLLTFPKVIIQISWDDIAQIRATSPVRAMLYFKTPTEVELTVPWQSSYESHVPKSVGFQKDTNYRYKN